MLTLYFINKKNGRFFPEFLLKLYKAYFHKIHFTFSYITLLTEHSPKGHDSLNMLDHIGTWADMYQKFRNEEITEKEYLDWKSQFPAK